MESRAKKSGGVGIAKRNRSLDLKSIYKNRASDSAESKKKVSEENDHKSIKKKRTRSKKEVSLSSFESELKRSRTGDADGLKPDVGISQNLGGGSDAPQGVSLVLAENGNNFNIPKRPRGSMGRIKLDRGEASNPLQPSNSVADVGKLNAEVVKPEGDTATDDQSTRSVTVMEGNDAASNSKLAGKVGGSKSKIKQKANSKSANKVSSNLQLKRKAGDDRSGRSCSVGDTEKEFDVAVNSGGTSLKKRLTNYRKKENLEDSRDGKKASKTKLEPSVGNSVSDKTIDVDEDDDDEENLEQNAARMLSSRFDPSCTGFLSKRKSSASEKAKGSNFSVSSTRDLSKQQANSSGDVDSESDDNKHKADDTSRALRPRREDKKGKGVARKRRHFYDILPRDIDPLWFLERKIKVFWPLDESWYFGVVNDYHPECKLFHIKYADGDDEWIDLQEEKFKLLLFPSEIPNNAKPKKSYKVHNDADKVETVTPETGDRRRENCSDSEPIASWLARSSNPSKSFPKSSETERASQMELPTVTSAPCENAINLNSSVAVRKGTRSKGDRILALADTSMTTSVNGILAVYVRKKNRKGEAFQSASVTANPVASIAVSLPTTVDENLSHGCGDSDELLWSIDHGGKLRLNIRLESKKFRFQVCLALLPSKSFSLGVGYLTLLHDKWMIQHMAILPASSAVALEVLFIDTYLGLRFLLFDGCMEQAMAFFFQILNFCSAPDKLLHDNMQSPVTSIRFRLSSSLDVRKHHVFEFHCFSRLHSSEWVGLSSRLQNHCLLLKQLPASECTYDNIKQLEHASVKQCKPDAHLLPSSDTGFSKQSASGILPMGISEEACTSRTNSSALDLAKETGNIFISFSATPTILLKLHLRLMMENTFSIPLPESVNVPLGGKVSISMEASDADCRVNEDCTHIPDPGGHSSQSGRSHSSAVQNLSLTRPAKSPKFMRIGFSSGQKKPRAKVQYTMPDAGYDFSSKQKMKTQSALPCKRIRRAPVKRVPDGPMDNQKNFELLTCGANVLVTLGDRGWRECGALVVLEVADHKEWKLSIKLSGVTKYSCRVKHILQPGTTNRHTHAMMWKGGKDWLLEFPDRSQWNLFKEMYEECYNRNIRAASVKNIPIPGVKLIDQSDDYGSDVHLFWHSTEYFKQVQTDVEMALDPLHILYDMDTDDEQWLMANGNSNDETGCEEISNELLEKTIDMFEKVSYVQHCNSFTDTEIQEILNGIVSVEAAKNCYEYWQEKRRRKGVPLIRHLQPPLWQQYQQQLKEWEKGIGQCNSAISVGTQQKVVPPKKPPMFAFCLKPQNLDVSNKGSKQRSHRKFPISRYHDGKRSHNHIFGDEKLFYPNGVHDLLDFRPSIWSSSMRMLSPQDTHFPLSTNFSKSKHRKRICANKRRKVGQNPPLNNLQAMSYCPRTIGNGNGVMLWNMGLPYSSSNRPYYLERSRVKGLENIDVSELDDLQLRDASNAARYALEIARVKREKARRLFDKADAAVHKAVAALMTADAIRAAYDNSNGDVGDRSIVSA